jgi:hypothetical protein
VCAIHALESEAYIPRYICAPEWLPVYATSASKTTLRDDSVPDKTDQTTHYSTSYFIKLLRHVKECIWIRRGPRRSYRTASVGIKPRRSAALLPARIRKCAMSCPDNDTQSYIALKLYACDCFLTCTAIWRAQRKELLKVAHSSLRSAYGYLGAPSSYRAHGSKMAVLPSNGAAG